MREGFPDLLEGAWLWCWQLLAGSCPSTARLYSQSSGRFCGTKCRRVSWWRILVWRCTCGRLQAEHSAILPPCSSSAYTLWCWLCLEQMRESSQLDIKPAPHHGDLRRSALKGEPNQRRAMGSSNRTKLKYAHSNLSLNVSPCWLKIKIFNSKKHDHVCCHFVSSRWKHLHFVSIFRPACVPGLLLL